MHRLTVLEHDVVCYIDDVVDRAHSGGAEAAAHPHRGGRDPHVFHDGCAVAAAKIDGIVLNGEKGRYPVSDAAELGLLYAERSLVRNCALARKSDHGEAVGAIRRDLELNHRVGEVENLLYVFARLGERVETAVRQDEYPVLDSLRHIVQRKPELGDGAEHSLRNRAAELAFLYLDISGEMASVGCDGDERPLGHVGRAGDNLQGIRRSDVDFAYYKFVGIRMGSYLKHTADDNSGDIVSELLPALDLRAGGGHAVAVFLRRILGNVRVVGEPLH